MKDWPEHRWPGYRPQLADYALLGAFLLLIGATIFTAIFRG